MANRVFQGVVCQMKDAIGRNVGVLDETLAPGQWRELTAEEISMLKKAHR